MVVFAIDVPGAQGVTQGSPSQRRAEERVIDGVVYAADASLIALEDFEVDAGAELRVSAPGFSPVRVEVDESC
ncbi:hypothetical protein G6O69_14770 [Pseudenhygromyxa sp. WMMC2535]|uniref:hypothetical protein n=1 Tax=Pseudenhygromyxa sp. WMMC2535 TaxID=2712867 RepID=UPI001595B097|nr:hypothetical protein [Pseudenhygromyxa sp. WMMC2535]NVB39104.1 hypothetical protein [Pseudenhygromyxa sp. WMMC2535]